MEDRLIDGALSVAAAACFVGAVAYIVMLIGDVRHQVTVIRIDLEALRDTLRRLLLEQQAQRIPQSETMAMCEHGYLKKYGGCSICYRRDLPCNAEAASDGQV